MYTRKRKEVHLDRKTHIRALFGSALCVSAGGRNEGATEDRKQAVTSACSQLAAPHQALLASPALRSHHFIARVTQEVDLVTHTVRLTEPPPIGGRLKFRAGTFTQE